MPKRPSNFVSPFEPVDLPAPKRAQPAAPGLGAIFAQWVQNFGGGVGVFAAVAVALWLFGRDAGAIFKWATAAGVFAWAVLMAARSVVDELVDYGAWLEMQAELDAIADERDEALQQLEAERQAHAATKRDRDTLRYERDQLHREQAPSLTLAHELIDEQSISDADTLLQLWERDGRWPARGRTCQRLRWDDGRWRAAYRLLQEAGIIEARDKSAPVFVGGDYDYAAAVAMLNDHIGALELGS